MKGKHAIVDSLARAVAKPIGEGNGEAAFGSAQNFRRQIGTDDVAQNQFALPAVDFP